MSISPELVPLQPGDRIGHRRFGVGVVLMRSGDVLDVLFDEDGEIRRVQLLGPDVEIEARSGSRISPTWDEIVDRERFVPRLTYGEIQLARLLDSFLPADWRIYVRPHLDGDHPPGAGFEGE